MAPQAYPRVRLRLTGTFTLAALAETTVQWQSADYDSHSGWSPSDAANYHIPLSGLWLWTFGFSTTVLNDVRGISSRLYVNGTIVRPPGSGSGPMPFITQTFMVPGDAVQVRIFTDQVGVMVQGNNTVLQGVRIATDP